MIIVTGGAGFIGSAIVAALNKRGIDNIVVVDDLGSDLRWKNLVNLSFADYINKDDFLELVLEDDFHQDIKTIFHMGACSSTTETNASYLIQNNFQYTKLLASWAFEHDIRFIYASSAATYGDGSKGFSDDEEKLGELAPLNMYGYSKHLFDLWARRHGLLEQIVGLKYFNVFGPNEYHKADMRSFVLKSYEQIRSEGKVKLFKSYNPDYPDGQYKRDFLYVKDAVEMTLFFMDNPDVNGIFNIGTGNARTWNDMVKAVFAAMDKKPDIEFVDMPENLQKQYQYFTQADMTKLSKAGCKLSITPLELAVTDYVKNYLINNGYLTAM
ncbi:MAG: ADP-glyceromanno-heptose 6-epimerase [Phycisphaerae bacterium]|jgi:ADP-L-glycero-D-manno-heptose 6-epimerase